MIDRIKTQLSPSKVIQRYIELKKKNNLYWGLCPFHKEKTPSFAVNDEKQIFHCFGCGISGDIFKFIQELEQKPFSDVVRVLCEELGIKYSSNASIPTTNVLQSAMEFYVENLNEDVYRYLENRNIHREMIEKFQIGFAPGNNIIDHLYKIYDAKLVLKSGITTAHGFDRFRNRIIIPIKNRLHKVIGFAGRNLTEELPKYINSAETEDFHKNLHLFGEQFLNESFNLYKHDEAIIVEGYMDVIKMHQYGFVNTFGIMGLGLNQGHFLTLFQKYSKVFLLFDNDNAGKRALHNNINIMLKCITPHKHIFIVELVDYKDPDELLENLGADIMQMNIKGSLNLKDWIYKNILRPIEDHAIYLEKVNELTDYIKNQFVKIAWKKEWRIYTPKHQMTHKVNKPSEHIILSLILNNLEHVHHILDNLFYIELRDNQLNEIFNYIIENPHLENIKNNIKLKFKFIAQPTSIFLNKEAFAIYIKDYYEKLS